MNAEKTYAALESKIAGMTDAEVIDAFHAAKANGNDRYILAALAGEMLFRGISA